MTFNHVGLGWVTFSSLVLSKILIMQCNYGTLSLHLYFSWVLTQTIFPGIEPHVTGKNLAEYFYSL